jgi:hypothetical protein
MNAMAKLERLMPLRESSPGCRERSLVAVLTELSRLLRKNKYMAVFTYGAEMWTRVEANVSRPTGAEIAGLADIVACRAVTMQRSRDKQI